MLILTFLIEQVNDSNFESSREEAFIFKMWRNFRLGQKFGSIMINDIHM